MKFKLNDMVHTPDGVGHIRKYDHIDNTFMVVFYNGDGCSFDYYTSKELELVDAIIARDETTQLDRIEAKLDELLKERYER